MLDYLILKILNTLETNTEIISLREDGIVTSVAKPSSKSYDDVYELLSAYEEITEGRKHPFLIDPTEIIGLPSRDARKLAKPVAEKCMSAFAPISKNAIAIPMMNFMLRVDGMRVRARAFKEWEDAIAWLLQFR